MKKKTLRIMISLLAVMVFLCSSVLANAGNGKLNVENGKSNISIGQSNDKADPGNGKTHEGNGQLNKNNDQSKISNGKSNGAPENTEKLQNSEKQQTSEQLQKRYIPVQILGINDFHGQIDITKKVDGRPAGRADYLAAYLRQRESENKNTLMVHAGDVVGASAPVSALLQDEPTIEILNTLGFDVGTVGNHEFDEGLDEMLRLINGGNHPLTGDFEGASFPYIASNIVYEDTGKTVLPPYVVKRVNGMPIAFIGVAYPDTPTIVVAGATEGLKFTDPSEAVNKAVKELKAQKVRAIVVIAHLDGYQNSTTGVITGNIADLANEIDDEVDVIIAGHNHGYLNGEVDNKLIVESYSGGTAFSDVDLQIDPNTKDVVEKKAEIVTTYQDSIQPDAQISAMIAKYQEAVAPIVNEVVGTAAIDITRTQNASGESSLGNLIADAQRDTMKTQMAFMNPGGIRADLAAGEVTWGELFNIQPFYNSLVKMDLTGAQIKRLLNQQWQATQTRFLQISGLKYTWDSTRTAGDYVVDISLPDGTPIGLDTVYTVTVNNFLAGGGDGFTVLTEGTNVVNGPFDIDALVNYIKGIQQPFSASIEGRITKLNQ